jgi:hypothetical protein
MAILNRHNDSQVFVCISKGEYQRVSGAGIRPFYPFAFAVAKMLEKAPISLKNGYQMIVFSTKRAFIEYKIDTISP